MQWLTGLLAFAVTMLIFAMIVSSLVEMIHRIFRLRSKGLRMMLESLFDQVIKQRMRVVDETMNSSQFAAKIVENRSVVNPNRTRGPVSRFFDRMLESSAMTHMDVEVFMQKLADNSLIDSVDGAKDDVLRDVAQKFESYGDEFGTYFERRARLLSVAVALLVAWVFYVHPYNLIKTYVSTPAVAAQVADRVNESLVDYRVLAEQLELSTSNAAFATQDAAKLEKAITDLRQEIHDGHATVKKLSGAGVPVGWPSENEMSACVTVDRTKKDISTGETDRLDLSCSTVFKIPYSDKVITPVNCFWLLLGGLLVGLGAPFWARTVSSLAKSRDLTRRITAAVNNTEARTTIPISQVSGEPATVTVGESNIALEAFKVSANAQNKVVN